MAVTYIVNSVVLLQPSFCQPGKTFTMSLVLLSRFGLLVLMVLFIVLQLILFGSQLRVGEVG